MTPSKETFLAQRRQRMLGYLVKRRLTQKAFAQRVGISPTYMTNIINGKRLGTSAVLAEIERASRGRLKVVDMVPPADEPTHSGVKD